MPQYTTVGGYPNPDPYYISPEEEAAMEASPISTKPVMQHTRGPWTKELCFADTWFIRSADRQPDGNHRTICLVSRTRDDETKHADGSRTIRKVAIPTADGDAALIAAIPAMLAALYEALDYFEAREDINYEGTGPNAAMSLANEIRAALGTSARPLQSTMDLLPPAARKHKVAAWGVFHRGTLQSYHGTLSLAHESAEAWKRMWKLTPIVVELTGEYEEPWS